MAIRPPGPPQIDNDLPWANLPIKPPSPGNPLPIPQPPYDNVDPDDIPPLFYLRIFYPGFFDPNGPNYVPPAQVIISLAMANEMKPTCLKQNMQWIAQAHYAAYLLQEYLTNKASGGIGIGGGGTNSGIILSEKEGDISVTYADPSSGNISMDETAPSSAYAKWKKLSDLCKYGAITTIAGRPYGG